MEGKKNYINSSRLLEANINQLLSRMPPVRASGPLSSILRSVEPIKVVVPTADTHALSIAMRISHALLLYFRVSLSLMSVHLLVRPHLRLILP